MIAIHAQKTIDAPLSTLERQLIIEFLADKGYRLDDLQTLPSDLAKQLMKEACANASLKLTEIEARSLFRNKIHCTGTP